jgi:hypothetical protein
VSDSRDDMLKWLTAEFPLKLDYDFWYQVYDDLDDCFDGLEPWLVAESAGWDWHSWDEEFTGKRIKDGDRG